MDIVCWKLFLDVGGLRWTVNRLLEEGFVNPYRALGVMERYMALLFDVYQNANEVVVKAFLLVVKLGDVEIAITGDTLTVKGEAKDEKEVKEEDYFCQEQNYGTFSRSIVLPADLKFDDAKAIFDSGVLKLTISRAEEKKPKTIKIKAKETKKLQKINDVFNSYRPCFF